MTEYINKLLGIIDWFIRPEFKTDKVIFQKARLLVIIYILSTFYVLTHVVIFLFIKYYVASIVLSGLILTAIIGLFLFKKTISVIAAANSIVFWAFLSFLVIIFTTGGIYSPTVSWLLPVSLLGFLLANRLSGYFWSSVSIVTIIILYMINNAGIQFPILLPKEYFSLHNVIAFLGSSLFVLLVVAIYDTITRQRTKELEETNKRLEESEISLNNSLVFLKQKEFDLEVINAELLENAAEMEQQTEEIVAQKEEIESQRDEMTIQKKELESKNRNLTDSIQYALRIQEAMLPSREIIAATLPDHFIFFKPRDIVSGDFYWFRQIKNFTFIAAADCTGHGVPGAFMSTLGISLLNEIITRRDLNPPHEVLNELRKRLKKSLQQKGQDGQTQDGMDIALCSIDHETNELQFSGAFNPLYLFRKTIAGQFELIENKADRMPIGIHPSDSKNFTTKKVKLQKDDTIYIFSDGYTSQFGGEENEKFKTRRFKDLLMNVQILEMEKQKLVIENTFNQWQGIHEQVDDILVIGVKIK